MKSIKTICRIAILSAILFIIQVAMAPLPNIELVSFLIVTFALVLSLPECIIIVSIFSILEMLMYGIGDWVITYYWIWPLLIIIIKLFKKILDRRISFAIILGFSGLLFGSFCSITTLILFGPSAALSYLIAGLSFDLIHGVSNLVFGFGLYDLSKRIRKIIEDSL